MRGTAVKPLFKRFQRFEKSLYGLKRPIFESEFRIIRKTGIVYKQGLGGDARRRIWLPSVAFLSLLM